jgi:hypothetical protein
MRVRIGSSDVRTYAPMMIRLIRSLRLPADSNR